jgi:hypothetical protein
MDGRLDGMYDLLRKCAHCDGALRRIVLVCLAYQLPRIAMIS